MIFLTQVINWLMTLVGSLGYTGVFIVIGLEYACFPIPSEAVLPFVGMSVSQTELSFLPTLIVSVLAGIMGSLICYVIGYYGGKTLLNKLSASSHNINKATNTFNVWFERYGCWAVLFSRIVPLTRTYISLFAGVNGMPCLQFILYSSIGIAIWNLVLISLGVYVGNNWGLVESLLNTYSHIVLIVLVGAGLIYLFKKWKLKK